MVWSERKLCPLVILLYQVFEVHGHLLYQDHIEMSLQVSCVWQCALQPVIEAAYDDGRGGY